MAVAASAAVGMMLAAGTAARQVVRVGVEQVQCTGTAACAAGAEGVAGFLVRIGGGNSSGISSINSSKCDGGDGWD